MTARLTLHFDGGIGKDPLTGKQNPDGIATYGWSLFTDKSKQVWVARGYGMCLRGKGATNNLAEYYGLLYGLKGCRDLGILPDLVCGDSEVIIYQVSGRYRCKLNHLRILRDEVRRLFPMERVKWMPREKNEEADGLSGRAIEQAIAQETMTPWSSRFVNRNINLKQYQNLVEKEDIPNGIR